MPCLGLDANRHLGQQHAALDDRFPARRGFLRDRPCRFRSAPELCMTHNRPICSPTQKMGNLCGFQWTRPQPSGELVSARCRAQPLPGQFSIRCFSIPEGYSGGSFYSLSQFGRC
jgi:hypothetical protein